MSLDCVKHPDHYCKGRKYEPKDVIYDWGLDFNLGSAVKYLSRAGRKAYNSKEQDLEKAIQYIQFELDEIQKKEKDCMVKNDAVIINRKCTDAYPAYWILQENIDGPDAGKITYKCSHCGYEAEIQTGICHSCGKPMIKEKRSSLIESEAKDESMGERK